MFEGFSPETIDFLWGLRMNNNREWFTAHKQEYTEHLYLPMKELAAEISEPFVGQPEIICKTSRIYRDMRMPQPTPYKESLWICIRRNSTWWMKEPGLCFEITPDGINYGFLFWDPGVETMNKIREAMVQNPERFLQIVKTAEKKSGIALTGKAYVRRRACPEPSVEKYYQYRNLLAIREEPVSEAMFAPELATTVRNSLEAWYPMWEFCRKFVETEPKL